jgi:hypothetical protein
MGYGVEIPCEDVGSATGNLVYFIQAFDAQNNVVSFSGSRNEPNKVAIRARVEGEPIHLPGQPPPAKCVDKGDCPPGFPGCAPAGEEPCVGPDCPGGPPEAAPDAGAKNWLSLALQQDFLLLGGATNTCSGGNEYACFQADTYYANIPFDRSGGELSGGFTVATTRILAGYDRAIGNFTLGARIGFAFGGGPQAPEGRAFLPFHAEARVAYWFGSEPFARTGLRPYIALSGGMAQIDGSTKVIVYDTEQDFIADRRLELEAWKKSGLAFISAGGGLMYAFLPSTGPLLEVKFIQLLGASGTALGGQLGYAFGF